MSKPVAPRGATAPRSALAKAASFVGSFHVAVAILVLLALLTFFGTLAQIHLGIHDVQQKYFAAPFVFHRIGPLGVPLLGASVLLPLLFVNLFVGGIVRLRKDRRRAGILVAHVGILMLLAGGLVEALLSDKGAMRVNIGRSADAFESYTDWEIVIARRSDDDRLVEVVLPSARLASTGAGDRARFVADALPFDVVVEGYARNASPRYARDGGVGVDGVELLSVRAEREAEANSPGAIVSLVPRAGGATGRTDRGVLWGGQVAPWVVERDGERWEVDLRRRRYPLPFRIALKKFVNREHPGTDSPAEYSSYTTMVEGGFARDVHITMNEPLRHEGFTLYQSGFGPSGRDARGNKLEPQYSVFAVVRNPSDRVPLASCVVIAIGLLGHFLMKLISHASAAQAVRTRTAAARGDARSTAEGSPA